MKNRIPSWLPALLLFLTFGAVLLALTYRHPADTAYQRGMAANAAGSYEPAVEAFTLALRYRPDFAPAYYSRSEAYTALGDYEHALADLQRANELTPDMPEILVDMGDAYAATGQLDRAAASYQRALELADAGQQPLLPRSDIYVDLALVYAAQGEAEKAMATFDQALALPNTDPAVYLARGGLYAGAGNAVWAGRDYWEWMMAVTTEWIDGEELLYPGDTRQLPMTHGRTYFLPFFGDATQRVAVTAEAAPGSTVDPLVLILEVSYLPVAGDDDSAGGMNAFMEGFFLTEQLAFFLVVTHADGGSEGDVILTFSISPPGG